MDTSKSFQLLKARRALHDVDVNGMPYRQNSALRAHLFEDALFRTSFAVRIRELARKQRSPQSVSKLFRGTVIVHSVNRYSPMPLQNQQGRDNTFELLSLRGRGL